MKHRAQHLLTSLTTITVLAIACTTATARRLETSNETIRAVWSFVKFSNAAGGLAAECPLTLEGSFHSRTISKVNGQLIGVITRAIVGAFATCRNRQNVTAVVILATTLPWHIRYDSFVGTLPGINEIRIQLIGTSFLLTAFGVSCLYKSTAARPLLGDVRREAGGIITDLVPLATAAIPLFEGIVLCPTSGVFTNGASVTAAVTLLGTTTKIRVTLVQ